MTDRAESTVLPVGGKGTVSTAWWGMACLIGTEGILFVYLIFSYAYLGTQQPGPWPPAGPPELRLAVPNTIILIASSVLMQLALRRYRQGRRDLWLPLLTAGTIVLGTIFVVIQGFEWAGKDFGFTANSYSSIFFLLTGVHMAHVVVGLLMLIVLLGWTLMGRFQRGHHEHLALGTLYWHFVDVVWLAVFTTVYLTPRLL
jgi:cytochrome c oxidase subunit 3